MRVKVLYFAAARDLAGTSEEELELEGRADVDGVRASIGALHPALAPHLGVCRFARNERFAEAGEVVLDGDVVAVLPPVSGGSR
jgi:molybdopterin converting factor subunit 1